MYNFKQLYKQYKKSALELLQLRNELISILSDIKIGKYDEELLSKKRDDVLHKQICIYKNCLDANKKAVRKAAESLTKTLDNTYTDEEINKYLPINLRK